MDEYFAATAITRENGFLWNVVQAIGTGTHQEHRENFLDGGNKTNGERYFDDSRRGWRQLDE